MNLDSSSPCPERTTRYSCEQENKKTATVRIKTTTETTNRKRKKNQPSVFDRSAAQAFVSTAKLSSASAQPLQCCITTSGFAIYCVKTSSGNLASQPAGGLLLPTGGSKALGGKKETKLRTGSIFNTEFDSESVSAVASVQAYVVCKASERFCDDSSLPAEHFTGQSVDAVVFG